jgi:hypothetical protein
MVSSFERKNAVVAAVCDAKRRRVLDVVSQMSGVSERELRNIAETGDVSYYNEILLAGMLDEINPTKASRKK